MRRLLRPGRHGSVPVAIVLLIGPCVAARGQDKDARPAPSGEIAAGMAVVLKAPDILLRSDRHDRTVTAGKGVDLKVERVRRRSRAGRPAR